MQTNFKTPVIFGLGTLASLSLLSPAQAAQDNAEPTLQVSQTVTPIAQTIPNVGDGVVVDSVTTADSLGADLFLECAAIISDASRLACFDSLAQGNVPSLVGQKRQVKLADTVKSALKGDLKLVYATEEELADMPPSGQPVDIDMLRAQAERYTPLSVAYDLDKNNTGLWTARPHNAMYVLPLYFNASPNRHPETPSRARVDFSQNEMQIPEMKFQLSVKTKAAENLLGTDADLWFGYTQQSHWQVYNSDYSRPFRAHDYQPEIFVTQPVTADLPFGGRLRMLGAGLVHHSNGEEGDMSRSWNRAYMMAGAEWGKLTVIPRLWSRINNEKAADDDNPDITDYYGYGDIKFLYQLENGGNLSGTGRYNPSTNKGALQLDYIHPIGRGISGYVQLFHGYGQSIIDYNESTSGIGVGVMLNNWTSLQ